VLQDVQIHVLVLDSLFIERTHGTHYSLPQSLEFVRKYRPTMTRLVGMTHEVVFCLSHVSLPSQQCSGTTIR
jgi:hypothetical protein